MSTTAGSKEELTSNGSGGIKPLALVEDAVKETANEITASGQQLPKIPPQPTIIPLSELEQAEIQEAARQIQGCQSVLHTSKINVENGKLDASVGLVAAVQIAALQFQNAKLFADLLLWKHRASHACPDGTYTQDLKALSVPVKE